MSSYTQAGQVFHTVLGFQPYRDRNKGMIRLKVAKKLI